jgi:hypothetical protein
MEKIQVFINVKKAGTYSYQRLSELCVSPVTVKGHHLRPLYTEIMWFSNYGSSNMLVNMGRIKTSTGAFHL